MSNRSKHETGAPATAAAWNNTRQHVSNDSSLGGDEFYDAVEDVSSKTQRVSGVSSGYGSNRSARARSSSAGTLVPNAEAAELMKVVASTNSSVKLDVSAFATPGEYAEEGPGVSSLAFDASHGAGRSKNPFSEEAIAAAPGGGGGGGAAEHAGSSCAADAAAETRRLWLSGRPRPAKMVVEDISSAENTPAATPVNTPGGGMGDGSGVGGAVGSASRPPRLPARGGTAAVSLNPFAEEEPLSPTSPSTNPFVTASSTLNPFADDSLQQQEEGPGRGGGDPGTPREDGGEEKEAPLPRTAGGEPGTAVSSVPSPGDAGVPVAAKPVAPAAAVSASEINPKRPPPLPPRRVASPSPSHQQLPNPTSGSRAATEERGDEGSIPVSPRSTASIATCDSSGGQLEGSEGGADAGSVGSSTGSDGTAGGKAKRNYMVVNKDTGQKFDVRKLEEHLPAENYALLPSRNDLIELEKRRSANDPTFNPATPTPTARSDSASPRSALSATVAASVSAAVGATSSRREKAKSLGSMMRRKLGKVKTAASPSPSSSDIGTSGGSGGGDKMPPEGEVRPGSVGGGAGGGAAGERSSIGGMGAAAKAAREALAGIRVSFKGKEASETLAGLMLFQELRCHDGPIWTAAFNQSGQFLATAGQDARILLHRVGDVRDAEGDGEAGDGDEGSHGGGKAAANGSGGGPGPSAGGEAAPGGDPDEDGADPRDRRAASGSAAGEDGSAGAGARAGGGGRASGRRRLATVMIDPSPWQIWEAHKGDVVALSWSRNDFLLSASLDKSVRLWHTTQRNCLHCFHHAETVTSVDFHPLLEHFFLSGCFDKKIRVWNIRDGRVQEWQQAPDLVTAAKFSLDGQMIVAGLYMGQVLFYQTEGMRYFTQIECRNRRGTKKRGCKVSGFAFKRTSVVSIDAAATDVGAGAASGGGGGGNGRSVGSSPAAGRPGEPAVSPVFGGAVGRGAGGMGGGGVGSHVPEQLLVTTNDSRLRLYNTDDFGMNAKYKGFANDTLQITATFSEDGKQIISGSENGKVYVWSTGVFATASPSTLPLAGGMPAAMTPQQSAAAAPPAVAPTQKDTNQRHESFYATSEAPKIVTTACFVPESTSRACVTAVRGGLSRAVAEKGGYCGCMILATDYNGSVRVYCKSAVLLS
eukprot:g6168.t1